MTVLVPGVEFTRLRDDVVKEAPPHFYPRPYQLVLMNKITTGNSAYLTTIVKANNSRNFPPKVQLDTRGCNWQHGRCEPHVGFNIVIRVR